MKRKIRYNAFETNSSSAQAICISKKNKVITLSQTICKQYYETPLEFKLGTFGWEFKVLKTPEEKASYLYTAIFCFYEDRGPLKSFLYDLSKILNKYDIKFTFTVLRDQLKKLKPFFDGCNISYKVVNLEGRFRYNQYNIDELWGFGSFVPDIFKNEYDILTLIFGDSFIVTGNDNAPDFEDYMCKAEYDEYGRKISSITNWKDEFKDYEIYYKGN